MAKFLPDTESNPSLMYYFALAILLMIIPPSFKQTQLTHTRVRAAYEEKEGIVKNFFAVKNIPYSNFDLFLRAFKKEMVLEVWIKEKSKEKFVLLHTFDFCSTSGVLGPKRKEGDLQIPEGVYHINHFNPQSNFHLSLGINYPNASDKILSDKQHPGSAIYIHGNCVTVGCIPITDDKIKEVYILAVEAKNNGQEKIPVHIFPTRMNQEDMSHLFIENSYSEKVKRFWKNLQTIYTDFESSKKLKMVSVNQSGEYFF